jgi:hypothetical protein
MRLFFYLVLIFPILAFSQFAGCSKSSDVIKSDNLDASSDGFDITMDIGGEIQGDLIISDTIPYDTIGWDTIDWDALHWDTLPWDTLPWDTTGNDTVMQDT